MLYSSEQDITKLPMQEGRGADPLPQPDPLLQHKRITIFTEESKKARWLLNGFPIHAVSFTCTWAGIHPEWGEPALLMELTTHRGFYI